jgi:hypothetical protein
MTLSTASLLGAQANQNFVSITPCRIADTRNANGVFGGPSLTGGSARDFPIQSSACNIPSIASAYVLNITVLPAGPLAYLTIWPTGQSQPTVSTLNSPTGQIIANSAVVSAGTNGAVSIYVSDTTGLILDISGYFVPLNVVNQNVGTFGSSAQVPVVTVNALGQVTAASSVSVLQPNFSDAESPSGVQNGTNAKFTLAKAPASSSRPLVTKNGVVQKQGADYTLSGNVITFVSGAIPQASDTLQVWYRF